MNKINDLKYEMSGKTIVFTTSAWHPNDDEEMYDFSVEGDTELTQKLLNAVKKKRVEYESIFYCATALFEIIRKKAFTPLASRTETTALFEKFQKAYGANAIFDIDNLSSPNFPRFIAELFLRNESVSIGEGRSKQQAKTDALKKHFDFIEA
jgi:hypothetical protein